MSNLTQELEEVLDRLAVAIKPMAHHAAIVVAELKEALTRIIDHTVASLEAPPVNAVEATIVDPVIASPPIHTEDVVSDLPTEQPFVDLSQPEHHTA